MAQLVKDEAPYSPVNYLKGMRERGASDEEIKAVRSAMTQRGASTDENTPQLVRDETPLLIPDKPSNSQYEPSSRGGPSPTLNQGEIVAPRPNVSVLEGTNKPFHPGQILDFLGSPLDPEAKRDIFGEPPKPTVDPNAPFHPGQIIGNIGDFARENFHDIGGMVVDALSTPLTWLQAPMVGTPKGVLRPPVLDVPVGPRGFTPESHPSLNPTPPGRQVLETGKEIPILRKEPLRPITELGGESIRPPAVGTGNETGAFYPLNSPGEPTMQQIPKSGIPAQIPGGSLDVPETVQPYSKWRGLRSAEEILQEQNKLPLREAEALIPQTQAPEVGLRPQKYFKPAVPEGTGQYVSPLTEALQKTIKDPSYRLYPQEQELVITQPSQGYGDALLRQPKQAGMDDFYFLGEEPGQMPPAYKRMRRATTQVLRETGQDEGVVGNIIDYADAYSEQGTLQNFKDWESLYKKIYPNRQIKRPLTNIVLRDLGAEQYFTKPEVEALLALNEYGGDVSKMPLIVRQTTPVTDPLLREFWEQAWQIATGRVSNHPAVQANVTRYNPITGNMLPIGAPSPFNPHIPVTPEAKMALSEATLKRQFYRQGYDGEFDYATWKQRFLDRLRNPESNQPNVEPTYAKNALLERARLLDLGVEAYEENKLVGDIYKKFGYEADPVRAMLRYNLTGLKRASYLENRNTLNEAFARLSEKYGNRPEMEWIETAIKRAQGISVRDDFLRSNDIMGDLMGVFYGMSLKTAAMTNVSLQPSMHMLQVGYLNGLKGLWNMFGKQIGMNSAEIEKAVEMSAANFPSFLARYTYANNAFQKFSKVATELNLFSPADVVSRNWAAYATYPYAEKVITNYYKNPMGRGLEASVKELGLNPKEVLEEMKLQPPDQWRQPWFGGEAIPTVPDHLMERAIQTTVNRNMGRTGPSSLPLWAQGDGQFKKMYTALQRQLLSNSAAMHKIITDAPTWEIGLARAMRLALGPAAGGALYTIYQNMNQGRQPLAPNMSLKQAMKKAGVQDEDMQDAMGFWLKSTTNGIGTFGGSLLLSGLNFYGNPGFVNPPFLAPAPQSYTEDILRKLAQGKYGQALYQAQPLPIPPALWKEEKEPKGMSMPGMRMKPE